MLFETKKIKHDTLSEYLVEIRQSLGLSLEEVSSKTGIKINFLSALEEGEFELLPADVYVLGFLRQLARLYVAPTESLIDQFKRERGIAQQLEKKRSLAHVGAKKYFSKIIITPKILAALGAVAFVGVTVGYIVWQVLSINKTPSLEISQPQDRQVITQTAVDVLGQTDPGISVTINDQSVFVDNTGNFKAQISVDVGPKDLVFIAKNKFGKTVTKRISIIGQPVMAQTKGPLTLTLAFTGNTVVSVSIDQDQPKTYNFVDGDSKTFSAQNKVVISTSDAGATRVTMNNQVLGPMGRAGENLTNVQFAADSSSINTNLK